MRSSAVSWATTALAALIGTGLVQTLAAIEAGTLTIQSQPDVEVTWDGAVLGTTDASGQLSIGNIPPGTYTLTFTSPGFTTRIESVGITTGRQELDALLVVIAEPSAGAELASEVPQSSVGAGLAPARGADTPTDEAEAQAPEPKPQDHKATTALLAVVALIVLAAFLLADRRSRRRQITAKPQGPRIVVQGTSERPRKLPTFYDDLKRRETDLEDLVDVGSGRSERQVIDVEVVDPGAVEDD